MPKVTVSIALELIKPAFTAQDLADVIAWVKTNITDKVPPNASATYALTYMP